MSLCNDSIVVCRRRRRRNGLERMEDTSGNADTPLPALTLHSPLLRDVPPPTPLAAHNHNSSHLLASKGWQ